MGPESVMQRLLWICIWIITASGAQAAVRGGVAVVAVDVPEQREQARGGVVQACAVLDEAGPDAFAHLFERPARARHADHRNRQAAAAHQRQQDRRALAAIAAGARPSEAVQRNRRRATDQS